MAAEPRAGFVALVTGVLLAFGAGPGDASARPHCAGKRATIVGGQGRDSLRGTGGSDVIVARGGRDRIRAGGGRDVICAGAGRDRVVGGKGRDVLLGGPGADVLIGSQGSDKPNGGPGADLILGGPGGEHAVGGPGDDRMLMGQQDDRAIGSGGNDVIIGEHGNDHVSGGAGDDWLRLDQGGGSANGGPGIDTYSDATASEARILLSAQPNSDASLAGIESAVGTAGADRIEGVGFGTAIGLGFDPAAVGYKQRDQCGGFSVIRCDPYPAGNGAVVQFEASAPDPGLVIRGSDQADVISISDTPAGLRVQAQAPMRAGTGCSGGGTSVVLCPHSGRVGYVTAYAGEGDDTVSIDGRLGTATVQLGGDSGADRLLGGPGDEMMDAGRDDAVGPNGEFVLSSSDLLSGGGGDDALAASPSVAVEGVHDVLLGGRGSDQLIGSNACSGMVLNGGPGGSDIAGFAQQGRFFKPEAPGIRARIGGTAINRAKIGGDRLCIPSRVSASNEILEGTPLADTLIGNSGNNHLILGKQGNDRILGLGGNDHLRGDEDRDTLMGGGGVDVLEAADGASDRRIDCGPGGGVARRDGHDPRARRC